MIELTPSSRRTPTDRISRPAALAVAILMLVVLVAPPVLAQGNGPEGAGGNGGDSGGPR